MSLKLGPDTTLMLGYEHFKNERTAERGIPSQARINGITATDVIGPFDTGLSTVFGDPANSPSPQSRWRMTDLHALYDHVRIEIALPPYST
jgi:hypothetical protein